MNSVRFWPDTQTFSAPFESQKADWNFLDLLSTGLFLRNNQAVEWHRKRYPFSWEKITAEFIVVTKKLKGVHEKNERCTNCTCFTAPDHQHCSIPTAINVIMVCTFCCFISDKFRGIYSLLPVKILNFITRNIRYLNKINKSHCNNYKR